MEKTTSVVTIIVTYNRKNLLIECIDSLQGQKTNTSLDIYIIDNASTDGTKAALQEYIDNGAIKYFNTGTNLGGAGGFEFGIRQAAKNNYDYVWIMDDDTIPTCDALNKLLKAAERIGTFGFLSSQALWTDGSICTMNVQRKNIFQKLNLKEFEHNIIPVEYATFVSLFVPMTIVREIGAPIGEFFIWGDDWEYTRRISKKYKSYVVTGSKVIHKTGTNIGCDISDDIPERISRYKYAFRNDAYIARQDGIKGIIYRWLKVIKNIIKVIFKSKNAKRERLRIILCGIKEGKNFDPQIAPL